MPNQQSLLATGGTGVQDQAAYEENVKKMDDAFVAQMRSQAHSLINEEYAEFLRKHLEIDQEKNDKPSTEISSSTDDADLKACSQKLYMHVNFKNVNIYYNI